MRGRSAQRQDTPQTNPHPRGVGRRTASMRERDTARTKCRSQILTGGLCAHPVSPRGDSAPAGISADGGSSGLLRDPYVRGTSILSMARQGAAPHEHSTCEWPVRGAPAARTPPSPRGFDGYPRREFRPGGSSMVTAAVRPKGDPRVGLLPDP